MVERQGDLLRVIYDIFKIHEKQYKRIKITENFNGHTSLPSTNVDFRYSCYHCRLCADLQRYRGITNDLFQVHRCSSVAFVRSTEDSGAAGIEIGRRRCRAKPSDHQLRSA